MYFKKNSKKNYIRKEKLELNAKCKAMRKNFAMENWETTLQLLLLNIIGTIESYKYLFILYYALESNKYILSFIFFSVIAIIVI